VAIVKPPPVAGETTALTTVLTPALAGELFRLCEADAAVIVGSGVRVPAAWPDEYRHRMGPLDLTFADCCLLTGVPEKSFRSWQERGRLKVRAVHEPHPGLLVQPAELVRVLRAIAKERNGSTEVVETPAQQTRRGESDRAAALAACDGG
jgi:hypothetical protein